MSIDWNEFEKEIDGILVDTSNETSDELASKVSSLTKMTDDEVKELFPNPSDVKKLTKLMTIVKSSEDKNRKLSKIVSNAEEFGEVMLTLLGKFV